MAAVDLIQVIQHAVLFAIEADELPEHGETGGLDEDLLDLPVGLQPAIRQEQHQNGPAQAHSGCERLDDRTGIFLKSNLFIGIIYIYFHTNIYYHISMKGESI